MSDGISPLTGGRILLRELMTHGARLAFGVPGESYLSVLDALVDQPDFRFITCRQEGGAAMMAEAHGKLTGEPGICFVSRGPGATSASAGVHVAFQDSTPMILFIGQAARDMIEREAFQEIDYRRMYGQMAKWVAQIDDPVRIPEYLSRAFYTATSGRPGPVVLALPEDMLTELAEAPLGRAYKRVMTRPGTQELGDLRETLLSAERPFVILGGGGWTANARIAFQSFAEANNLPVGCSFRCQDYFDNDHPNYAGHVGVGVDPKLRQRIQESDLLLVVGARLGEITTGGYSLIDVPVPRQKLIHVHAGAEELGRVYSPDLAINASPNAFAKAVRDLFPVNRRPWDDWTAAARADYIAWRQPVTVPGEMQLAEVVAWLDEALPADAVFCNGAGNYATWVNRFRRYRHYRSQLAPTSGSMGYGLPAALAAKAARPGRQVVCFAGDGCYLMHGQELATAVHYGLDVIIIVVNNGIYGTIRMHQEREYPARVSGTDLANPDFAAYARAFGAWGERVARSADFAAAFGRALEAGGPALLELTLDPEVLTPQQTLGEIRAAAREEQD